MNGLRRDGIAIDRSPEALEMLLATRTIIDRREAALCRYVAGRHRKAAFPSHGEILITVLAVELLGGCAVLTHLLIR